MGGEIEHTLLGSVYYANYYGSHAEKPIITQCMHTLTLTHTLRGAFSEVFRAQEKTTSKEYAIKVIDKKALRGKEEALQMEIQVLQK